MSLYDRVKNNRFNRQVQGKNQEVNMGKFDDVKRRIEDEASGRPGDRTQNVPCAFCVRGGNGDRSCASGMNEKRYSKFKGCFAGKMLETAP